MKPVLVLSGNGTAQDSIEAMTGQLRAQLSGLGCALLPAPRYADHRAALAQLDTLLSSEEVAAVITVGYTLGVELAASWPARPTPRPLFLAALPDIPGTHRKIYDSALAHVEDLARTADALLVSDEPSRSALEYSAAGASGRTHTLAGLASALNSTGSAAVDRGNRAFPRPTGAGRPCRVLVSSHDFRFIADTVTMLRRLPGFEVQLQHWDLASATPTPQQQRQARWADVVLCEWAGRNAVWYSQNLGEGKRLLVRLHGFEVDARWIGGLNLDAVEKILAVSSFYARQVGERLSLAPENITVVPNSLSTAVFERQKMTGSPFHLGMLGYTPLLKRPQVAVEILRQLLHRDDRYVLHLRGSGPTTHDWLWFSRADEADAARQLYTRIGADEQLRDSIAFEAPGANVESWLSRVGWILSLSERETFHLAAAEGMASGAVPVFLPRPGVEDIFGSRWLFSSPEEIADFIHATVQNGTWAEQSAQARRYARRFDFDTVADLWLRVILGD